MWDGKIQSRKRHCHIHELMNVINNSSYVTSIPTHSLTLSAPMMSIVPHLCATLNDEHIHTLLRLLYHFYWTHF